MSYPETDPGVPGMTGMEYRRRSPYLRGSLVLGGIVAALAGGAVYWQRTHVPVYFDNGLPTWVTVRVDGAAFTVAAGGREKRELAPGTHPLTVTGPRGEIERYAAQIPAQSSVDDLFGSRFFVYNVAEARAYARETVGYAERREDQSYKPEILGLQRFFVQTGIDYTFEPAPEKIQAEKNSGAVRKVSFNVLPTGLNGLAVARFEEGNLAEAEKALQKALEIDPCERPARQSLVNLLNQVNRPQDAFAAAEGWIACPEADVEAHRAYQEAALALGRREALLAEYRTRLAAHPEVGANHYLYARLLADKEQALAEYGKAVRLDPQLARAYYAMGSSLLGRERYGEALAALRRALGIPHHATDMDLIYALSAVGAGPAALAPAEETLRQEKDPEEPDLLWRAHWVLALAGSRFDEAESLFKLRNPTDPLRPADWRLRIQLDRLAGHPREVEKLLTAARLRPDLAQLLTAVRLEQALAEKRFKDAADVVDKMDKVDDGTASADQGAQALYRVYAAAAVLLAGDRAGAEARLAKLDAELSARKTLTAELNLVRNLVDALRHPVPADRLLQGLGDASFPYLPHAYFILGVRATAADDPAAAHEFFEKSRKTALDLDFPYFAAKGLASSPTETPGREGS
jgi:tetratricopeptide (TPR) repeat protein